MKFAYTSTILCGKYMLKELKIVEDNARRVKKFHTTCVSVLQDSYHTCLKRNTIRFRIRAYRFVRAIVFAVNEINQNYNILPNITLGFNIYDSCFLESRATGCTLQLLSGRQWAIPNYGCRMTPILPAIIGDEAAAATLQMATLLRIYKFPQLLHYLKNVEFVNSGGEKIFFDANGDLPAVYDILNWHIFPGGMSRYIQVGMFDYNAPNGQQIKINETSILWSSAFPQTPVSVCSKSCLPGFWKAARRGQPICCFDCLPCSKGEISNQTDATECMKCPEDLWPDNKRDKCIPRSIEFLSYSEPLGATLASIPIFLSIVTVAILCIFIKNQDTPIVKANNRELSYLLLLALMCCFLCSLIFIGKPKVYTCMFRQPAFGAAFALCVSSILGKTITVVIAFNATNPTSVLRKWTGSKTPAVILFICVCVQVVICICWLTSNPSFPQLNMKSQEGKVIVECNEGSIIMLYTMLGYLASLVAVSLVIAFFARKLPDSFNEARFISFSMLVFASVWLTFIPAYLSTQGKYMVAVEIFAIVSSSAGILCCIFIPKCYIIILRPEMNTRDHLMGSSRLRNKT
ncbi:vomeronasal type-2 receptor 26-like [Protopterus annectens]|uniref:vomeronasal type-2 receptor 26-like n=1 Tax=Protopterus annectens TaxID=7888 RepID=UPI001CFAF9C6|nr:vomeronasal type-2 receptor 26-like [Protopterus annectens]